MTLHRSALHPFTAAAAGGLRELYGWELPAAYSDAASEYRAATDGVAVHDASYMGRLRATGADALDLLNRLSTNKVVDLQPGQGAPTILTTDRGRILDLVGVVHQGDHILIIISPGTQGTVIAWLDKYTILEDLTVEDITGGTAMLAVCGPGSRTALEAAAGADLGGLKPYHCVHAEMAGHQLSVIHSPLAGLPRYFLVTPGEAAPPVWRRLVDLGATAMGTDAAEALRIGLGVPAHGPELGEEYNPLEAGLIGAVDFAKGCYIGQEVIARLDTYQKVQKRLVRLTFGRASSGATGASLLYGGKTVGRVTSVAGLPHEGATAGLAYVRAERAAAGARLELEEPAVGWAEVRDLSMLFGPGQG